MSHKSILTFMGIYYFVTGLWPLVHMRSFELITGPKKDHWLVKTVSLLILSSSIIFLYPWIKSKEPSEVIVWLALLNATSLMAISTIYPLKGRVSKIYLADALIEFVIIVMLIYGIG